MADNEEILHELQQLRGSVEANSTKLNRVVGLQRQMEATLQRIEQLVRRLLR